MSRSELAAAHVLLDEDEEPRCYECGRAMPADSSSHGICSDPCFESWVRTSAAINSVITAKQVEAKP